MKEFEIDKVSKIVFNEATRKWDTYKNNKLLSKKAKKLYNYYSLSINNIDALLNNYFYLSNPSTFNDPFDCNLNLIENVENEINKLETVKRNNISNIGITSLSEVIDSNLMWGHYANNYNGFAIEFDGENIDVKIAKERFVKNTLTRVNYSENLKKIKKEFPFALHYVLTTKMKDWKYEKEWRIICDLKEGDDRILYYYPEKVKGIYVGHQLIDNNESAYRLILEICEIRFPNIPIYVVYPHHNELKLMFEKVLN